MSNAVQAFFVLAMTFAMIGLTLMLACGFEPGALFVLAGVFCSIAALVLTFFANEEQD